MRCHGPRRRRLIPEHIADVSAIPHPDSKARIRNDAAPATHEDDKVAYRSVNEWTAWSMIADEGRKVKKTSSRLRQNDLAEVVDDLSEDGCDDRQPSQWSAWERWQDFRARENQLLVTLLPIPMFMITIFLAISWYCRRRRPSRTGRSQNGGHPIELELIRNELSSDGAPALGQPRIELLASRPTNAAPGTITEEPPPYSEMVGKLYPLVSTSSTVDDPPPPYCDVTKNARPRQPDTETRPEA